MHGFAVDGALQFDVVRIGEFVQGDQPGSERGESGIGLPEAELRRRPGQCCGSANSPWEVCSTSTAPASVNIGSRPDRLPIRTFQAFLSLVGDTCLLVVQSSLSPVTVSRSPTSSATEASTRARETNRAAAPERSGRRLRWRSPGNRRASLRDSVGAVGHHRGADPVVVGGAEHPRIDLGDRGVRRRRGGRRAARASAAGFARAGLLRWSGASARGATGQSERGVGEVPPAKGGAVGFPGRAGLRRLRVRTRRGAGGRVPGTL